ncbi:MAG: 7-carboxy-7-deazaguanine synthase QueE [Flavobacteriaceae bacterium TMED179]|nr:MAG: 7-carboxy-7-deazaguanine synthase QueE [Flavobacteriaceae bacterium TMED179]|tara:strand:+ start:215 stop:847 length:633 start_codon:yes stop_codon:yes gene_type:complete
MMGKTLQDKVNIGIALPVMEAFYTIQGEGYHKGSAAYFIRIGGCDVGCHWCDVKQSWDAQKHPVILIDDIVSQAIKYSNTIVITGGEPLMWNMIPLTKALKEKKIQIHIETSGAYKITGQWDWFCLSPKKNKLPTQAAFSYADELKVIIYNNDDLRFAEKQAEKVNRNCILYLQPEWSKRDKIMPLIVNYILQNPKWKVSLQTHKYLNIP